MANFVFVTNFIIFLYFLPTAYVYGNHKILASFLTLKTPVVCTTLIFTNTDIEDKDFSDFTLQNSNSFQYSNVVLSPDLLSLNQNYDILSFTKELKTEHVVNPTLLGVTKFIRNCASVLILEENRNRVVDVLVSRRFARPHKDYFFFLYSSQVSELNFKAEFSLLRYKYIVQPNVTGIVGFCGKSLELFSHLCPDLISGKRLQMASSNTPALFRPSPDGGSGALYCAFKEIDLRLNSSSFLRHSSYNGSAGMRLNNGTGVWKGTVGDVFNREVNMSIATGMTTERLRFTDFSVTHMWNERVFFIRIPPLKSNWLTLVRPLSFELWTMTLIALFIFILPAMYVMSISQGGFKSMSMTSWFNLNLLYRVIDTALCIFLEQSTFTRIWKGSRVRLIIILWSAFCLVLTTGYKSKLVNFLTFSDRESVPQTHMELSLSDYKLFFRSYKGIALLETKQSTNPMHKRFMARAKFPDHSFECFMDALTIERSACMDFILNGEYTIAVNATLKRTGDSKIFVRSRDIDIRWMIMWIFPKASPLTATYDRIKLQFLAAGLFDKWMKDDWAIQTIAGKYWLERQRQSKAKKVINELLDELDKTGQHPLSLNNVVSIFLIWGLGVCLGSIVWVVEALTQANFWYLYHYFCYCIVYTSFKLKELKPKWLNREI